MKKEYYIQGDPARAEEIKAAFEKLGFDPAGWDCDGAHSVYFTVPGDNKVKSLHISIGKVIMTHPDYQELELPAKPNFKVGDWAVTDYGKVSQVVSVDKDGDGYTLDDGVYFSGSWCDMYHHWAISDVKDGDVLTDGKKIVIFNKFEEPTRKQCIMAYAGLDLSGKLQITEETKDSWRLAADRIMPATKEQRDLLFQKMKEAGYQWDEKEKELRKIINPKFKVGDWVVSNGQPAIIYELKQNYYLGKYLNGHDFCHKYADEDKLHLWTIQDAKDGDVLAADECYVIFKEIDGLNIKCYCTYHYMGFNPSFHIDTLQNKTAFHPAKKEQREVLFAKMREAGYQWYAEKKELKKFPKHYDISSFYAGMPVLVRDMDSEQWTYTEYSHYDPIRGYKFMTSACQLFVQCIPFEGNKKLLGTTDMCDEQYINW